MACVYTTAYTHNSRPELRDVCGSSIFDKYYSNSFSQRLPHVLMLCTARNKNEISRIIDYRFVLELYFKNSIDDVSAMHFLAPVRLHFLCVFHQSYFLVFCVEGFLTSLASAFPNSLIRNLLYTGSCSLIFSTM